VDFNWLNTILSEPLNLADLWQEAKDSGTQVQFSEAEWTIAALVQVGN